MRKNTLAGLTSIRFFAAIWVVFHHLRFGWKPPELLDRFFDAGYSGVTLFFILSGFILSYNYLPREFTLRDFWSARMARILPIYFFALLVSFPFSAGFSRMNGQAFFPSALPAFFLVQAWIPRSALTWNWPGWSLSVEAFFYLLFPFLLRPFARLAQRHAALVLGAIWMLSLIPSTLYALALPEGPVDTMSRFVGLTIIKFNPLLRLPEFLIGIALGVLYLNGAHIPRPRLAAAGCVLALVFIVLGPWRLPYPVIHNGLLAPLYGVLILAVASEPKMLANPILELLGESSYSLYLLHASVIVYCSMFAGRLHWPVHGSFCLIWAAIAVLVSIASYKFIEVPARRFLRSTLMRDGLSFSGVPNRTA
ncbi:MAG: acyltransferase [Terracidiphilus sp.]|jgi:peptidoglycan/LPS O-acetylase OafA/YrhL